MIIQMFGETRVQTKDMRSAGRVADQWMQYPAVLKQAGDRLHWDQCHPYIHIIAGKDYKTAGMHKGDAFFIGR